MIKKIGDPGNYRQWLCGFISYTHLSGLQGREGSGSRIKYIMKGRETEVIETIMKITAPKKLYASYETKKVFNIQKNHFEKVAGQKTRWITDSEFQFKDYMKILCLLKPGMFKKQSWQMMKDFKDFAENGKSVLDQ